MKKIYDLPSYKDRPAYSRALLLLRRSGAIKGKCACGNATRRFIHNELICDRCHKLEARTYRDYSSGHVHHNPASGGIPVHAIHCRLN